MSMFAKRCTKTKLCLWAYLGVTCVDVTSDGGTILNIAISGGTNEEEEEHEVFDEHDLQKYI